MCTHRTSDDPEPPRMFKRRKGGSAREGGQEKFEKVMFSFMGPAHIGDYKAPEGYVPDETANLCHKCDQRWERHERVHTGTMTYRRCPPSSAA